MKQANLAEMLSQKSKRVQNSQTQGDTLPQPKKRRLIQDEDDENKELNESSNVKGTRDKESIKEESQIQSYFNEEKSLPFKYQEDVPFSYICSALQNVGEQKGANSKDAMKEIMAKVFYNIIKLKKEQLIYAYLFCIVKIGSDYEQGELGIGQGILVKSISNTTGRSEKQIRDSQNQLGDLGLVVEKSKGTQTTVDKFFVKKQVNKPITLEQIFTKIKSMASIKGQDSSNEKERIIQGLLRQATPEEAKYIIRFIEKNLKIGAAEKTMQAALAKAFYHYIKEENGSKTKESFSQQELENAINRALCEFPNYEKLIETLISEKPNPNKLQNLCYITPGVPCKPMLAKPMKSIQMILHRFENIKFTCEFKYDGLRGQIHYNNGEVSIYSRNLENMTETYPDIVSVIKNYVEVNEDMNIKSFIMDSEIVAFETQTNRILPFQILASRAKKNVEQSNISVQVCLFMFDMLYFNGKSLLQDTFISRRTTLRSVFKQNSQLQYAQSIDSDAIEDIEEFLIQSVKIGCEGLMIKTIEVNSEYEPAKRSYNWLKLKKDYLSSGMGDSFDLVPIGALMGAGKRYQNKQRKYIFRKGIYGSYLLACYNDELETYETICKIGTGFSEEKLDEFYQQLQEHIIKEPLMEYKCENVQMDVWFRPSCVWEVKGADLQISPVYQSCRTLLGQNRGIGLRFPRLIKVREDKKPDEATTAQFIYDIYKQQAVVKNQNDFNQQEEDDYY